MRPVHGSRAVRDSLTRRYRPETATPPHLAESIERVFGEVLTVEAAVERVTKDVRRSGDEAVLEYSRRIDGVTLRSLRLSGEQLERAYREASRDLIHALKLAASRIRSFHESAMPKSWHNDETGLGQRFVPINAVGVYVPGGIASYPSTVLHTVIPAKVAGVERIVVVSPPRDGGVAQSVLAAAHIAGVNEFYQVGGPQAIAALAYGTQSIERVDKICGPGNVFVTEAKRRVYGSVGVDGLNGPTETLIVADASVNPDIVSADLLAQAEHDVLATPILLTDSQELAERVVASIERQIPTLDRFEVVQAALANQGLIGVVDSIGEAIEIANDFAPEHLCLLLANPGAYVELARNAGGLFVGENASEVLGDYVAGPSHVMPTGGTARFASTLGVQDFLRVMPVINLEDADGTLSGAAATIAQAEGLTAHVHSAQLRGHRGAPKG